MIINDEHKYIFIHVPKVAGESIKNKLGGAQTPHHLPAKGIQEQFPTKWDSYYKFSFVRNPWSWLVSLYHFKLHIDSGDVWLRPIIMKNTFSEFIYMLKDSKSLFPPKWKIQLQFKQQVINNFGNYIDSMLESNEVPHNKSHLDFYLRDSNGNLPDYIGKIDTLQEDLDKICQDIGIERVKLLHQNSSPHRHYSEYYDDETRDIVAKIFAKDIEYFGWVFEEAPQSLNKLNL